MPTSRAVCARRAHIAEPGASLGISAVERETGLSRDTLRAWERRYGFPSPLRDAGDERVYPPEQIGALRLIRHLVGMGYRPGRIVGLPLAQLEALACAACDERAGAVPVATTGEDGVGGYLALLRRHDAERLRCRLEQDRVRMGLERFIHALAVPLRDAVDAAARAGALALFERGQFDETLQRVLRGAAAGLAADPQARPRVLLAAAPGQTSPLGPALFEAALTLEGCACVPLGVAMPPAEIARAALAHRADVIALSLAAGDDGAGLAELRASLPPSIAIWCDADAEAVRAGVPAGVRTFASPAAIAPALARWRGAASAAARTPLAPAR